MTPADWPAVQTIYGEGIATANATFEVAPPEWLDRDQDHTAEHQLVATDGDGEVIGWVAAQRISARQVYAEVLETSIYVAGRALI
jgi:phosphinothricin acetyltransferase